MQKSYVNINFYRGCNVSNFKTYAGRITVLGKVDKMEKLKIAVVGVGSSGDNVLEVLANTHIADDVELISVNYGNAIDYIKNDCEICKKDRALPKNKVYNYRRYNKNMFYYIKKYD